MRRPITITVVACFLFFATLIASVIAVALLWRGTALDGLWRLNPEARQAFSAFGRIAGVLLIALGIATLCAGVALLRGRRWAWWFCVLLFVVNGAGDLLSMFRSPQWWKGPIGVLVAGTFIYLLMRPQTRNFAGASKGKRPLESGRLSE